MAPLLLVLSVAASAAGQEYAPRSAVGVAVEAYVNGADVEEAVKKSGMEFSPPSLKIWGPLRPRIAVVQNKVPVQPGECDALRKEIEAVTQAAGVDETVRAGVIDMYYGLKGCGTKESVAFWKGEQEYRADAYQKKVQERTSRLLSNPFAVNSGPGALSPGGPGGMSGGTTAGTGHATTPGPSAHLPTAQLPANFKGKPGEVPAANGLTADQQREVNRALAIGHQSTCRLNREGKRSVGRGGGNGWWNNLNAVLNPTSDYERCYPQAEDVVNDMKKWGVGGPMSPWIVEIRNKEGWKPATPEEEESLLGKVKGEMYNNGHWWVRLRPKDPNAMPVVINYDSWVGRFSVDKVGGPVKDRDDWTPIPGADTKDCDASLPKSS